MKSPTYFVATAVAGLGFLTSIQSNSNSTVSSSDLFSAIQKGLITCESFGAGGYSGKSVIVRLTNKRQQELNITIPVGTLFFPNDNGQQTLITVEQQVVTLNPGEKRSQEVYAYCSEHNDRSPNKSTTFSLGRNKNTKFDSLFTFIKPLKIPQSDHQSMVWAVSDNSPVTSVASNNSDSKKLRKFLFKLTGQDEKDYTSGYLISVDQNGYIVKTLYQVGGDMEFVSDRTRYLYQEVYTPEGKMKYKSNMAIEIPEGKSSYNFNIVVKGWPKGTYTLKMKDGKEEVGQYVFEV
jgi:hypothetical protein